jgi:hypothetical protein
MSWSMLASAAAESVDHNDDDSDNRHGHAAQRATANITCNGQYNVQRPRCNVQRPRCNVQRPRCNRQRPRCNMQRPCDRTCRERADDHCEQHDADHDRCRREEYLRISDLTRNERSAASPMACSRMLKGPCSPVATTICATAATSTAARFEPIGARAPCRPIPTGAAYHGLGLGASRRYHGSARQRLRARPSCRRRS